VRGNRDIDAWSAFGACGFNRWNWLADVWRLRHARAAIAGIVHHEPGLAVGGQTPDSAARDRWPGQQPESQGDQQRQAWNSLAERKHDAVAD